MSNKASSCEALNLICNIVCATAPGGLTKRIDPLFARSIDMCMSDDDLYNSVVSVHNSWAVLIVIWILIVSPAMFTLPSYVLEATSGIQTAYKICAGYATISGIAALYTAIGTVISLGTFPKHGIRLFLTELGSQVRVPFTFFSLSMVSYVGVLSCCFVAIQGSDPNNAPAVFLNVSLLAGIAIAWYFHHVNQDRILLTLHRTLANSSPFATGEDSNGPPFGIDSASGRHSERV
jgi:hypothetical protein